MTHISPAVLRLELNYLPPSQNVLKRMHWTRQYHEKQKAFSALQSALFFAARERSTKTTIQEAARIFSTAFDTLALYRETQKKKSIFRSNKKKLPIFPTREPS